MSSDPTASGVPGAGDPAGQPSEEELRAAYEAELSRITSADLMLQATVSLLNVGSFRLAPRASSEATAGAAAAEGGAAAGGQEPRGPSSADLEQARDAIDGARALLAILERSAPSEIAPLRNALSQLQMAYARVAQAAGSPAPGAGSSTPPSDGSGAGDAGTGDSGAGAGGAPASGEQPPPGGSRQPGPAESSGRLWVPGR